MFYTSSLNTTLLIVGLGNIGKEFVGTRHNIGFDCLDDFVNKHSEFDAWINKKDLKAQLTTGQLGGTRIICIKPTTMMNISGEAVQATASFYKVPLENIVVVHDELDINFGQIRNRIAGSSAGHNGIKSVTQMIGENYGRVRIGIGPKKPARIDSADFVLQKFSTDEQKLLPDLIKETTALLSEYAYSTKLPTDTRSFLF
jgi:PTH1 family peptidyl-tRNA hydrolase